MKKNGFTLIELLVVIGILSILSSILVVYSHTGENHILFFREQARVVGAVFRAKNLSVSSYGGKSCGYGIHFILPDEIIIFSDKTSSGSCAGTDGADKVYSDSGEDFEKIILDSKVEITTFPDILFIPPEPTVYPAGDISIKLDLMDGLESLKCGTVEISKAGQITQKECLPS